MHDLSERQKHRFVAINCAAIPENLLESELFGHEKGAFTGAHKQTIGKVEVASGGTLFLDEIGDMPMPLQGKLLRFLQSRVIERIGGRQEIPVDVRIVCATNRNPKEMIAEQRFREAVGILEHLGADGEKVLAPGARALRRSRRLACRNESPGSTRHRRIELTQIVEAQLRRR